MRQVIRFYNGDELVFEDYYDREQWCSGCRSGATSEMCGGCVGCSHLQAIHSGMRVEITDEA